MQKVNQKEPFRQGEVSFYPLEWLKEKGLIDHPSFKLKEPVHVKPENGKLVIAHSETGHHHCIDIERNKYAQLLIDETNALIGFLRVDGVPVELEHLRTDHKHETYHIAEGEYIVAIMLRKTPKGWERVID